MTSGRTWTLDAMLQAILLTSSLVLMLAMCASLKVLSAIRVRQAAEMQAEPDA
jgi:hypothetical protein